MGELIEIQALLLCHSTEKDTVDSITDYVKQIMSVNVIVMDRIPIEEWGNEFTKHLSNNKIVILILNDEIMSLPIERVIVFSKLIEGTSLFCLNMTSKPIDKIMGALQWTNSIDILLRDVTQKYRETLSRQTFNIQFVSNECCSIDIDDNTYELNPYNIFAIKLTSGEHSIRCTSHTGCCASETRMICVNRDDAQHYVAFNMVSLSQKKLSSHTDESSQKKWKKLSKELSATDLSRYRHTLPYAKMSLFELRSSILKPFTASKYIGLKNLFDPIVVEPIYDSISSLCNRRRIVSFEGKYGVLNEMGQEVLPCVYDTIRTYSDCGLAIVELQGKYGVIDSKGIERCPLTYIKISDFESGYAIANDGRELIILDFCCHIVGYIPTPLDTLFTIDGYSLFVVNVDNESFLYDRCKHFAPVHIGLSELTSGKYYLFNDVSGLFGLMELGVGIVLQPLYESIKFVSDNIVALKRNSEISLYNIKRKDWFCNRTFEWVDDKSYHSLLLIENRGDIELTHIDE